MQTEQDLVEPDTGRAVGKRGVGIEINDIDRDSAEKQMNKADADDMISPHSPYTQNQAADQDSTPM